MRTERPTLRLISVVVTAHASRGTIWTGSSTFWVATGTANASEGGQFDWALADAERLRAAGWLEARTVNDTEAAERGAPVPCGGVTRPAARPTYPTTVRSCQGGIPFR